MKKSKKSSSRKNKTSRSAHRGAKRGSRSPATPAVIDTEMIRWDEREAELA